MRTAAQDSECCGVVKYYVAAPVSNAAAPQPNIADAFPVVTIPRLRKTANYNALTFFV